MHLPAAQHARTKQKETKTGMAARLRPSARSEVNNGAVSGLPFRGFAAGRDRDKSSSRGTTRFSIFLANTLSA